MIGVWSLIRFLHVMGAMVWVGGQLTITAMLLPVVRRNLEAADRTAILTAVGKRFGMFTILVFLPLQIVTGVLLAWNKGVTMSSLTEPGYGRTLAAKLVAFALVMIAAGAHSWARNTDRALLARALAIGSLIGSLVIVLLATALPSS
ncbi:MAG TPA: hypothetical protein VIC82_14145 [Candidatus Nanopelagicales bacterium]|jgi:uncharacterized membrane protein